jgi:hypothetical protein
MQEHCEDRCTTYLYFNTQHDVQILYLLFGSLYNNVVSIYIIQHQMVGRQMNCKDLEENSHGIYEVLSWNLPGVAE